ncbi:MAG TPA: hypothetical protein VE338_05905 [Ktedonobacterales bacterium]|jgi:hypothetical protein|nr:hypothetical protein [Ktedonobacterales bacterium]
MTESLEYPFAQVRIEAQARGNLNALILGSLAYARAQGRDGRHWATFIGQAFAPGWSSGMSPCEAALAAALNCASAGMQVSAVMGDVVHGEFVTSDWPDREELAFFALSQAEADQFWTVFEPIAQALGLAFSWRREGEQLHFTFTK